MNGGTSSGARSLILGRIRDILGDRPKAAAADAYSRIPRGYAQAGSRTDEARVDLFADRLEHYQVGVFRADRASLGRAIGEALTRRGKARMLVPAGIAGDWLPPGLEFAEDRGLTHAELDRAEGVLTGCSVAIALTGTIVLRHGQGEGRRALTLVPDYHLCVVMREQIVETVPEAIRLLAQWNPLLVTTISGPSATADIEMTRIRGVHGPRTLDVIVV